MVSRVVATTQWGLVAAARCRTGPEARRAMDRLCQTYWPVLYAFARRLGWDSEAARDLTQAYFAELLEKDFLAEIDAGKGRFRSFLFSSMRHFLSHHREKSRAVKRGGAAVVLSLEMVAPEEGRALAGTTSLTPEEVFEQRWAMSVIEAAMERLRAQTAAAGGGRRFELLRPYLTSLERQTPYRDVARSLNTTEAAVKVAVHRLRRRFARCLRAELAETVADEADVDDELRHLLTVVSG
jgi:RNA polymerase sigma factor (sigma-70 family)